MTYWRLFYHAVWGTKYGEDLIHSDYENALHHVIAGKAGALGGVVFAVGGIENHVHLVVSIPPTMALSSFVGQVKGNSAHFVNAEIRPGFQFNWQREFGIFTLSEKDLDPIIKYVKRQKEHHLEKSLIQALEPDFARAK